MSSSSDANPLSGYIEVKSESTSGSTSGALDNNVHLNTINQNLNNIFSDTAKIHVNTKNIETNISNIKQKFINDNKEFAYHLAFDLIIALFSGTCVAVISLAFDTNLEDLYVLIKDIPINIYVIIFLCSLVSSFFIFIITLLITIRHYNKKLQIKE